MNTHSRNFLLKIYIINFTIITSKYPYFNLNISQKIDESYIYNSIYFYFSYLPES